MLAPGIDHAPFRVAVVFEGVVAGVHEIELRCRDVDRFTADDVAEHRGAGGKYFRAVQTVTFAAIAEDEVKDSRTRMRPSGPLFLRQKELPLQNCVNDAAVAGATAIVK